MTTGMKHLAAYQANLPDYNAAKDRECNYIGNQIRAARKSMKLSLEQLSQILVRRISVHSIRMLLPCIGDILSL